jgi:protein tyrosine phosphatase
MGIINYIDKVSKEYKCDTKSSNFLMFALLKYNYDVKFSNKIVDNIWLGNYVDSSNLEFIKENNIKVIINCSKNLPFWFDDKITPFKYRLSLDDDQSQEAMHLMYLYLPKIIDLIKSHVARNENIYIHCHAGMQRSACVLACYLMSSFNVSPQEAVNYIKNKRNISFSPHVNFKQSMVSYYTNNIIKLKTNIS